MLLGQLCMTAVVRDIPSLLWLLKIKEYLFVWLGFVVVFFVLFLLSWMVNCLSAIVKIRFSLVCELVSF